MLAGLIFATENSDDRPDALAATLPFGGATLVEFQARLLIDAGASQILIAVSRVTPELLGAVTRIARRGVAVDIVRSAAEAAAKVHPLARVLVLADGLVTTDALIAPAVGEGGDLLIVADGGPAYERIDSGHFWAGIARLDAHRLGEAAELPRDYDFQSTLLRVAAQGGATRLMLPADGARTGHGIVRDSRVLTERGRAVFAALAAGRPAWVDRWLFAPVARLVLPRLVAQGGSAGLLAGGAGVFGIAGLVTVGAGWVASGLALVTLGAAAATGASMLARLRGEDALMLWGERLVGLLAAAAILLAGFCEDAIRGTATGSALAVALLIAAVLVERLRSVVTPRRWWGSPAAYPLLLIAFAAFGSTLVGLAALACYAAATLAAAIEAVRQKP